MNLYTAGLDEMRNWETDTFRWRMVKSGAFSNANDFMNVVITGGNEIAVAGYAPLVVTTPVRFPSDGDAITYYTCDAPDFGSLTAGETPIAIVLERHVTSDADSIPIGWQEIGTPLDTGDLDPYVFNLPGGIAIQTRQAAP